MKNVFPPDTHRLRDKTKNEVAIRVETQPTEAGDTDSNEIDLTPKKPPMTVAVYKFHGSSNRCDAQASSLSGPSPPLRQIRYSSDLCAWLTSVADSEF
jgi:hypothetical protein